MAKPRIAVILRYGLNPDAWRARHDAGEVVDRAPYGYDRAEQWFDLSWSSDHREGPLARAARSGLRRLLGFDLVHVWRNRRLIRQADAVWTHTEREHLAVAAIKALRPRAYRAVSVAQSVWLWDGWQAAGALRRALYARLLRRHAVELTLSRENRDASRRLAPGRPVLRIPFGTHPASGAGPEHVPADPPVVLTVGNDRHRDWGLLQAVTRRMPDVRFDLVTRAEDVRARDWPANVTVRAATQAELLARAYAEASVVAIPLRPNLHASGCTVAIEAMSARVPIVATGAGGIEEYLAGTGAAVVGVGDADRFARALRAALATRVRQDGRPEAARGLTDEDYIRRLAAITLALLEGRPVPAAVEAFAPMPAPAPTPRAGVAA